MTSDEIRKQDYRRQDDTRARFRTVIDGTLVVLMAALIIALVNGYILIQQQNIQIGDIQHNITHIQADQDVMMKYLISRGK